MTEHPLLNAAIFATLGVALFTLAGAVAIGIALIIAAAMH